MSRIVIDREMCKGCGLCVSVCPRDCFEDDEELNGYGVHPVKARPDSGCTGCARCALICPDTAIEVYRELREAKE